MKITRRVEIEFTRRVRRTFSSGETQAAPNFDREDEPLDEIVRDLIDRAVTEENPGKEDSSSKEKQKCEKS